MKQILLTLAALALSAGIASATTCERLGNSNNYRCETPAGKGYTVKNANSANAAAKALAAQLQHQGQHQSQHQGQSQSSTNTNDNSNSSVNSNTNSNSVSNVIEAAPKHTTSINLGASINVDIPIASGVQTRNAIDAADWFMRNGQSCVAYQIMAKAPRVRNLKINFNCGDKG